MPEELPPQDEPEVQPVPESDHPDADDEGHMAPKPASGSPDR